MKIVQLWNSSAVAQHGYRTAWLWGGLGHSAQERRSRCYSSPPGMQLCSSVATQWTFQLSSGIAALADVAESAGETVFCGNYVLHLDRNEAGLYREGFTHTLPPAPDWCVLLQIEDSKSSQCDWSKKHHPDWSEWSYLEWSVKIQMKILLCTSDWTGEVSILLDEFWS